MNEAEKAILAEMERNLMVEDERFTRRFTESPRPMRLLQGIVGIFAGITIVIVGITLGTGLGTAVSVAGFVLMFVAGTRLLPRTVTVHHDPAPHRVGAHLPPHER